MGLRSVIACASSRHNTRFIVIFSTFKEKARAVVYEILGAFAPNTVVKKFLSTEVLQKMLILSEALQI